MMHAMTMTPEQAAQHRRTLIEAGIITPFGHERARSPRWNRGGRMDGEELASAGFEAAAEMSRRLKLADTFGDHLQPMMIGTLGYVRR